jgi:hypothetical protein
MVVMEILQQTEEVGFRKKIDAIPAQMDAGENDFMIPGVSNVTDMPDDPFQGLAPAGPPGIGYDTVCAECITSILDF